MCEKKFKVIVKCNGYFYVGYLIVVEGIFFDLWDMKNVLLDMDFKIVIMDVGCWWGMVYEMLVIGKYDGFIINGGRCLIVGVSGFIFGGGFGLFIWSFGMGCDMFVEVKVVIVDGRLIMVREMFKKGFLEERLFWVF